MKLIVNTPMLWFNYRNLMRVSIWPIRRAGSLGNLTGFWKEATFHFNIFMNTRQLNNKNQIMSSSKVHDYELTSHGNYNPQRQSYDQRSYTKNKHGGTRLGRIYV